MDSMGERTLGERTQGEHVNQDDSDCVTRAV